jgi:hypothetical protein
MTQKELEKIKEWIKKNQWYTVVANFKGEIIVVEDLKVFLQTLTKKGEK